MHCTCRDWHENIALVEGPRYLLNARNPGSADYRGKTFKFCPWCAKDLLPFTTAGTAHDSAAVPGPADGA
jgi:hypothetical protein